MKRFILTLVLILLAVSARADGPYPHPLDLGISDVTVQVSDYTGDTRTRFVDVMPITEAITVSVWGYDGSKDEDERFFQLLGDCATDGIPGFSVAGSDSVITIYPGSRQRISAPAVWLWINRTKATEVVINAHF